MVKCSCVDHMGMVTVLSYIAALPAGEAPITFGCAPSRKKVCRLPSCSKLVLKVRYELQCIAWAHSGIDSVVAA
eukprot:4790196-Pyramimonas_sp.AAC.1